MKKTQLLSKLQSSNYLQQYSLQSLLLQCLHTKRSNFTGSISLGDLKSKHTQHSLIVSLLDVQNSFMSRRVTVKSNNRRVQWADFQAICWRTLPSKSISVSQVYETRSYALRLGCNSSHLRSDSYLLFAELHQVPGRAVAE